MVNENDIAEEVVDAAYQIHSNDGPGCLESAYEILLTHELQKRGRSVELQVPVAIQYNGVSVTEAFRIDLLVDDSVVIELKRLKNSTPCTSAKFLPILSSRKRSWACLLINFNSHLFKKGVHRIVNGLEDN